MGDGEEPRRKRGGAAEVLDAARGGEQGLLKNVLRVLFGTTHPHPEEEDLPLMSHEELFQRGAISKTRGAQELLFGRRVRSICHP